VATSSSAKITLDLVELEHCRAPEKDIIRRYLGMIQVQRQDFNGRVLTIRADDLRLLAFMLETTQAALLKRFDELSLRG
jgi:hypothetical protein